MCLVQVPLRDCRFHSRATLQRAHDFHMMEVATVAALSDIARDAIDLDGVDVKFALVVLSEDRFGHDATCLRERRIGDPMSKITVYVTFAGSASS